MTKISFQLLTICCVLIFGISCSNHSNQVNFDLDLIPVKSGDSWGYINPKGEYVINPQFADADFFREGLAMVKSSNGKVGYISKDGKYKIAAEYKDGTPFSEGLAFVVADGAAPVCIDKSGDKKFELQQAKGVSWFSEGFASFSTTEGKWGFVDKSGKVVINPQFQSAIFFRDGMSAILQDDKWGFIDKSGKIVINPQFDGVYLFSEGLAAFKKGNKWGYIDKKGAYVINPQFDNAAPFNEGMAVIGADTKYGFINKQGKIEINPQFEYVSTAFYNGMETVKQNGNGSWGFIDKSGKYLINPQFDRASDFLGDIALVQSGKQWGIIDKKGKYLVNPQFDNMKTPNLLYDSYAVTSDFYDTSEFIGKFFERAKSNSFDGFNASSTLQTIIDNATYGNGANVRYNDEYAVDYKKSQKLTDEISISQVSFRSGHGNPFYTGGYNKEYNFAAKIYAVSYELYLAGEARGKGGAITNALIADIQKRYNIKMEYTTDESGDSDYDWYEGANNTFNFSIIPKSDRIIEFYIEFKQQ